jgi:hypothetical protein
LMCEVRRELDLGRKIPSRDSRFADFLLPGENGRGGAPMKAEPSPSLGWPWFALCVAFALHIFDEATTGFLAVYNPTVIALRARWGWLPLPTFAIREFLVAMIGVVVICFALTPLAARGVRWMRPLAWLHAVIQLLNAMGHTLGTILGHSVESVTFPRPAPGFYSSPLLVIGSIWLMVRLRQTARRN